jgi:hypothetical protein
MLGRAGHGQVERRANVLGFPLAATDREDLEPVSVGHHRTNCIQLVR